MVKIHIGSKVCEGREPPTRCNSLTDGVRAALFSPDEKRDY